jgi:maltooligosyltrehalose trehalohydrolase
MPESATNDARIIRERELGGFGLDAQWNDDFHHALHVLLTNERAGYYQDYGTLQNLAKAFREGFVYSGEYSPYRQHRHGVSSKDLPAECFVVFSQNHDQVGNRMRGERSSQLVSFERLKVAAGLVILSPFLPLLFMGEEYGETAPFPYFVSHSDPDLIEAVRSGRREEFGAFEWGDAPDPQDEAVFWSAKLNHTLRLEGTHRILWDFYQEMIRLRKGIPPLSNLSKETQEVLAYEQSKILFIRHWGYGEEAVAVFNFGESDVSEELPFPKGHWQKRLDSAEERWNGPGSSHPKKLTSKGRVSLDLSPEAFVLFTRPEES